MIRRTICALLVFVVGSTMAWAGGWDAKKGLDKVTVTGELLCIGCSLKKLDGANAQCDLYAHHAIGFKTLDGALWSIVENAKGHDIVRSHTLLENKKATVTGWLYPIAHYIEIDTITVDGVKPEDIQKAAWEEDRLLAKRLLERKVGEPPTLAHSHDDEK